MIRLNLSPRSGNPLTQAADPGSASGPVGDQGHAVGEAPAPRLAAGLVGHYRVAGLLEVAQDVAPREDSQQLVWPQTRHRRSCTHVVPSSRQAWHASDGSAGADGTAIMIRCPHMTSGPGKSL